MIQTPQVFSYDIVKGAYEMLMREQQISVTDDAMVVEQMLNHPIRLVYGSYEISRSQHRKIWKSQKYFLRNAKKNIINSLCWFIKKGSQKRKNIKNYS